MTTPSDGTPRDQQTSAEAAGSIRDRLRSQPTGEGSPGDSRVSDVSEGAFQQTHSRSQLHAEGRGEAQHDSSSPPVGVEAPTHHELTEHEAKVAERKVAALFLLALVGVIGFVATFAFGEPTFGEPGNTAFTPLLGSFMALALFGVGAGAVLWAKTLMVDEEAVQERHPFGSPPDERAATSTLR